MGSPWNTAVRAWFKAEGRPSNDGRWWAFQVEADGDAIIGLVMYDREQHEIVGSLLIGNGNRPDHTSTSPLGNYAVVSWYGNAADSLAAEEARPVDNAAGVRAYSRDFSTFRAMSVLGEHSDLCIDSEGDEVFVSVSYRGFAEGVTDGGLYA